MFNRIFNTVVGFMSKMGLALLVLTWLIGTAYVACWLLINSPNWLFAVGSLLVLGVCMYSSYIFIDALLAYYYED